MVRPTDLPGGDQLRDVAVRGLTTSRQLQGTWDLLTRRASYSGLLPELVFQRLWEYLGDDLEGVFEILRLAPPNALHHLLSDLAAKYNVSLATTNFDLLIEEVQSALSRPD